jgi:hypothetical protein
MERASGDHRIGRTVSPMLEAVEKTLLLTGIKPQFSGRPAYTLIAVDD